MNITCVSVSTNTYDPLSHVVCPEGHLEVVQWLLSHGVPAHVTDRYGGTPLQDAVRGEHAAVAAVLESTLSQDQQ